MVDIGKIKEGLKRCSGVNCKPTRCPYSKDDFCTAKLHKEALELIEQYEAEIEMWKGCAISWKEELDGRDLQMF